MMFLRILLPAVLLSVLNACSNEREAEVDEYLYQARTSNFEGRSLAWRALALHAREHRDRRAIEALLQAQKQRDLFVVGCEIEFFIWYSEPGSEETLIAALHAAHRARSEADLPGPQKAPFCFSHGDISIADAFLNSFNSQLDAEARAWAKTVGYTIESRKGSGGSRWRARN
jgi:hypothetical protein